jgi:cobalt-zinc-cadmium efflux system membrane fusion protein
MMKTNRLCLALLAGSALVLSGCGEGSKKESQMTSYSQAASQADTAELFTVPAEQMAHVQVVTAQANNLPRVLRLTGTVAFNGFATTPVITQAGGPVSRILVSPGEMVRQGQALAYVSSPDYSQLRATYLKARAADQLAEKNYARAQDLYTHHAIAEKDLQQAESDRAQATADMQAAEQSMRIIGYRDPAQMLAKSALEAPMTAPIAGEVVERLCAPGQVVQAGTTQCFTISNTSTVWVLANVYQNDLAYVHTGDAVSITTDAYPDVFTGKISYLGAALDPASRSLQARIDTKNPQGKLKRDMYVTASVRAGAIANAITVPDAAVLRNPENQPYVYVQVGQNQFGRRDVTIGDSQGGMTQIVTGLKAGERVVGNGSLFLQFANTLQK